MISIMKKDSRVDTLQVNCLSHQTFEYAILLLMLLLLSSYSKAETDTLKWVFTGNTSLSSDFYSINSTPENSINRRRPTDLHRLLYNSNLKYGIFELPITIVLSSNQTNFTTQAPGTQTFMQYLQNPMNIIRIAPRIGDLNLQFGSFVPRYSELSTGNSNVFGLGAEYTPDNLAISVFYGISQRGVESDTTRGIRGAYERRSLTARLHYGSKRTGLIGINVVAAEDIESSVKSPSAELFPERGFLTTINFIVPFTERIFLEGEAGGSLFTRNTRDKEIEDNGLEFLSVLTPIKTSTRTDGSGRLKFGIEYDKWGIAANALYVGDGYVPMGYRFFMSDRLELTLMPKLRLFDGTIFLSGSIGTRINNLSNTKSQTSEQLLASVNSAIRFTDYLSLNAGYSNFGFRNRTDNDTLKIDVISTSFNLSPNLILRGQKLIHSITLSFAFDDYKDYNTFTTAINENSTRSITGVHVINFTEMPLTTDLTLMQLTNDIKPFELSIYSIIAGVAYRFFDNTLNPSLKISYNNTSYAGAGSDNSIGFRAKVAYIYNKSLTFTAEASSNQYSYGELRSNASFGETFVRLMVASRF